MREQNSGVFFSPRFFAGLLTVCLFFSVFRQFFRGDIPGLLPFVLLFFLFGFLGAVCGTAEFFRENPPLKLLLFLMSVFAVLSPRGAPELPVMIFGFFSGLVSSGAFHSCGENETVSGSFREYAWGSISGTVLSVSGGWIPFFPAAAALFLYGQNAVFGKMKKVRTVRYISIGALILTAAVFFLLFLFGDVTVDAGSVPAGSPALKLDMISAYARPDTERTLMVLPEKAELAAAAELLPGECRIVSCGDPVDSLLLRNRLSRGDPLFDLIVVEICDLTVLQTDAAISKDPMFDFADSETIPRGYDMANRGFLEKLLRKLRPGGVLLCFPGKNDILAGIIAASLSPEGYLDFAGGVPLIAFSDQPLSPEFKKGSATESLRKILYPSGWKRKLENAAAKYGMPDRIFTLERNLLKERRSPLCAALFNRIFRFSFRTAVILCFSALAVFLLFRYLFAYTHGAGLFLSASAGSFPVFTALTGLFFCRVLTLAFSGTFYCILLLFFSFGMVAGSRLPQSACKWRYLFLLPVYCTVFFCIHLWEPAVFFGVLCSGFLAGGAFPLFLKKAEERLKTENSGAVLFTGVIFGLLMSILLFCIFAGV